MLRLRVQGSGVQIARQKMVPHDALIFVGDGPQEVVARSSTESAGVDEAAAWRPCEYSIANAPLPGVLARQPRPRP
jgi:hypothetical protein